jgi:glycine C-acetyltransferase/8-amino-7-oxononanoate synthase
MTEIQARLSELKGLGLYRRTRLVSGPQGPNVVLDGRPVTLLCSNNYLGLADHPRVQEAAADAAMRWGVGAGSSRLVSGTMTVHSRLEQKLAAFKGTEAALLFGSGYLANLGVVGSLARAGEVVFSDELNHASIIDGCRLSRAEVFVYAHNDLDHLEWGIQQAGSRAALIVTESVFSMDGDMAPLEQISELAQDYDVRVAVDEAHATGCVGLGGRGAVAEAGLEREIDVVVGTLGKALGSYGAFVACDAELVSLFTNTARSLIFSTAPPPPAIAGALAALEVLEEQPRRVERLHANAEVLRGELAREGFDVSGSTTQIVPLIVGDAATAMRVCEAALERGVFAQAIRPPTVPDGTSRLRLSVMATHTKDELRDAAHVLGRAALHAGFRPATAMPVAAAHEAAHGEAPRRSAVAHGESPQRSAVAHGEAPRRATAAHSEAPRRAAAAAGEAPRRSAVAHGGASPGELFDGESPRRSAAAHAGASPGELFDAEAPDALAPAPRRIPRAA